MDLEATSSAAKVAFGKLKKMAAEKKRSKRFIFVAIIIDDFVFAKERACENRKNHKQFWRERESVSHVSRFFN